MTRKATDVLLNIEQQNIEILGHLRNQDMLLKNIINKISKNEVKQNNITEVESKKSIMPGLKPGVILNNDSTLVGKVKISDVNSSYKTQVQQRITFSDGKSVTSASVEIFSFEDNKSLLIENKKTNATGKWTASLAPGKYLIKVFKKESAKHPVVNIQDELIIPDSDKPVQLPPLVN